MSDETSQATEFRFLPDSPVTKDGDSFGSHSRVADSIARVVESDNHGMTISLEGTWGSGKSSVIRMLEERWKDNEDMSVFTFDAWAHDGDSLRRSFLEELILDLKTMKDKNGSGNWLGEIDGNCELPRSECKTCPKHDLCRPDIILEELTHRREEATITTQHHLGKFGTALAAFTLLIPYCVAVISAGKFYGMNSAMFAGVFAIMPFAIGMVIVLRRFLSETEKSDASILGKTQETTTHSTYRGVEPTSIEFRGYYEELLQLSLGESKGRRLVIVLDNLDRIGDAAALRAWSTMQTFLRPGEDHSGEPRSQVWLIVPHDPIAIEKLWKGINKEEQASLARAFKEKTFQIRHRVAPPLNSSWEDFFKKCLQIACPKLTKDEQHSVYDVFRVQAVPGYAHRIPTPREIKIFVNRLVSLALQHGSEVSMPVLALYAALEVNGEIDSPEKSKSEITGPDSHMFEELAGGTLPDESRLLDSIGSKWREGLAAIHFGVPVKDAAEVLFTPTIEKLLSAGDANGLKKLLKTPRVAQCCDRFVRDNAAGLQFDGFVKYAEALVECTKEDGAISEYLKRTVCFLAFKLGSFPVSTWSIGGPLKEADARVIVELMKCDSATKRIVASRLGAQLQSETEDLGTKLDQWAPAMAVIVNCLKSEAFFSGITIQMFEVGHYQMLLTCLAGHKVGRDVIRYFQPAESVKDEYRDHVLSHNKAGTIQPQDMAILDGLLEMDCWDKVGIAQAESEAVKEGVLKGINNRDTVCYGIELLLGHMSQPEIGQFFAKAAKALGGSEQLFVALHEHHADTKADALCLALLILYGSEQSFADGTPPRQGKQFFDKQLDQGNAKLAVELARICVAHGLSNGVFAAIRSRNLEGKKLINELLVELVQADEAAEAVTTDVFMDHRDMIQGILDHDVKEGENIYERLVDRLLQPEKGKLLTELEAKPDFGLMRVYHLAIDNKTVETSSLEDGLALFFRNVKKAKWLEEFQSGLYTIDVLQDLVQNGKPLGLNHEIANALVDYAVLLRDGKATLADPSYFTDSPSVFDCLSKPQRKQFRIRLLKFVVDDGLKPINKVLAGFGHELKDAYRQEFAGNSFDSFEAGLIGLAENEPYWLMELFADGIIDVAGLSDMTVSNLRDRLTGPLKEAAEISSQANEENGDEDEDVEALETLSRDNAIWVAGKFNVSLEPDGDDGEEGDEDVQPAEVEEQD